MLANIPNRTKYEWYGVYNSMGSGLEKDKSLDNMRKILYLSYGDLPSYLKPCLLYLSLFPEDDIIPRNDLLRLWEAEGFVDEKQGRNLYDIGERYFNELVNRSMIMPVGIKEYGVAKACRVHDMILDLIISLSAEEIFGTIPEGPRLKSTVRNIRRISLPGNKVDGNREDSKEEKRIQPATVNMPHVRSLIIFCNVVQCVPPLSRFSVLRVLSLKGVSSKIIHPKYLWSLHLLRYLELGGELEPELLEGIGNLKLLKTLDLWSASIKELPSSIFQLRQLKRLLTCNGFKLPDGIGNLTSLHELAVLDVVKSPNTVAELGKLTQLQELTIKGLDKIKSYMKSFLQSISNLGNLCTLRFQDAGGPSSLDSMSDQWRLPVHLQTFDGDHLTFSELPRWFSSSELSCLSICVNVLRQEDLELLGALPVLRFLKLHVDPNGTTEEWLVVGIDQPLRSLAEFKFRHFSRCWLVLGQGVMPRLQRLQLYFEAQKREGGGFDVSLENLTSLKHVTVKVNCNKASTREVEDVETKIRDAVDSHPNHPTLVLSRIYEHFMAKDENKDVHEAPEQQRKETVG